MDGAIFSMSCDYSALSSAVEESATERDYQTARSDVTPCSHNSRSSLSDHDAPSQPASPESNGEKEGGDLGKTEDNQHKSPGLSYIALISMAIQSAGDKRMLLSEIYQWIAERYPYYNMKEKSWRNSIRHNLSLNECFVKNGRSENGKGNYWSIHPANIEDFSRGDYRRRRARRRVRKCDEDLRRLCTRSPYPNSSSPVSCGDEQGYSERPEPPAVVVSASADGYVPMMSTPVPTNYLSSLGLDKKNREESWNFHNLTSYYAMNGCYKSRDLNYLYPGGGESCTQLYGCQQPELYSSIYTAQGASKYGVTRPTSANGELNVNVNVNVYGNATAARQCTSSTSPSYYFPPSTQAPKGVYPGYSAYSEHMHDFPYPEDGHGFSGCNVGTQVPAYSDSGLEKMPENKD